MNQSTPTKGTIAFGMSLFSRFLSYGSTLVLVNSHQWVFKVQSLVSFIENYRCWKSLFMNGVFEEENIANCKFDLQSFEILGHIKTK